MFGLLSTLAEILSSHGLRFFTARARTRDVEVAERLFGIVTMLQDLLVRAERLLDLAERLVAGDAGQGEDARFEELLTRQVAGVEEVRSALAGSRELLATVDTGLYLDLVPLLDDKSGLLARWGRHAARSRFSTTTLFFLTDAQLRAVLDAGRAHTGEQGMLLDRADYLLALSDALRQVRSGEVRDIRGAGSSAGEPGVPAEITAARGAVSHARDLCQQLVAAAEQAVGPEAMAGLRRRLLTRPGAGPETT